MPQQKPSPPTSVFCAAAPSDTTWLASWETHLRPLVQAGHITLWSDQHVTAGTPRTQQINEHLDQAQVIVFLLSADFFASDECMALMERALNNSARVIPLLLRTSAWQDSPFASLAYLPSNGQFVTTWDNLDQAFQMCFDDLRQLLGLPTVQVQRRKSARASVLEYQNRERMLRRLRRSYSDLTSQSLQGTAWLELGLTSKPDAVHNATNLLLRTPSRPKESLPPGTSITQAYDEAEHELLILGEPGAGKSTLLLDLATHLVKRAEDDETHPLPVILPLSSWVVKRSRLQDWMIEQLAQIYDVPRQLSEEWVKEERILPLLDGLDEMEETALPACIAAINSYHHDHMAPLVVCSRTSEYEAASEHHRLALQGAVIVQPLTHEHVDAYLVQVGKPLTALRCALKNNTILYDLTTTPLMFNILMLTYRGRSVRDLSGKESLLQKQVWDDYVQRMVTHKGNNKRYPLQETRLRLGFLARQMRKQNQTVFYLEHLQPSWLTEIHQYNAYQFLAERLPGALIGAVVTLLISAICFNELVLNVFDPFQLLFLYGLPGALIGWVLSRSDRDGGKPLEAGKTRRWVNTTSSFLFRTCGKGVFVWLCMSGGLSFDPGFDPRYALIYGSVFGLGTLLLPNATSTRQTAQTKSVTSVWSSRFLPRREQMKQGIKIGIVLGLCYGLSTALGTAVASWIDWQGTMAWEMAHYGYVTEVAQNLFKDSLGNILSSVPQDWPFYAGMFLLVGVIVSMLLTERNKIIQPAEMIQWSWSSFRNLISFQHLKRVLVIGIVIGFSSFLANLLGGVTYSVANATGTSSWSAGITDALNFELTQGGLSGALSDALSIGLTVAVISWWHIGLLTKISSQRIDEHQRLVPNQGIRRSGRNGLFVGLISGLSSTLLSFLCIVLILGATQGQRQPFAMDQSTFVYLLIVVLIVGLDIGLLLTLLMGGLAWLRHYVLRFLLWRNGVMPWRSIQFLDDATARFLLRRVGGGYSFAHRLLLDHLADTETIPKAAPSPLPHPEEKEA